MFKSVFIVAVLLASLVTTSSAQACGTFNLNWRPAHSRSSWSPTWGDMFVAWQRQKIQWCHDLTSALRDSVVQVVADDHDATQIARK